MKDTFGVINIDKPSKNYNLVLQQYIFKTIIIFLSCFAYKKGCFVTPNFSDFLADGRNCYIYTPDCYFL